MKLNELAEKFKTNLASIYEADEIQAIFLLCMEYYLKLNRQGYLLNKGLTLDPIVLSQIESVIAELITNKPIQYILGETTFYGLPFKVNESVLIPRPETEELVDWIIHTMKRNGQMESILDIGTGSGCIAISVKKHFPVAKVSAVDISSKALATAKQNALLNDVVVNFIEQDILQIQSEQSQEFYTVIVSNPPYITQLEKDQMHQNVLSNEPHSALFVSNEEPLIFYEAIANYALLNLAENGLLFFEINEYLGNQTVELLRHKGFINIELRKDMQGKDRMVCCAKT